MGGIGSGRRIRRASEKVERTVQLYLDGKLLKDIATAVNWDAHTVVKVLKDEGVYDPHRSLTAGLKYLHEANQKRHDATRKISEGLLAKIETRGFEYLGGYTGRGRIRVRCSICGDISERSLQSFRKGVAVCINCKRTGSEARKAEEKRKREEKKQQKEAARALINPLGLSPYQLEKERKLDEVNTCTYCGKEYTPRQYMKRYGLTLYSNIGVCSKQCQRKRRKQKAKERGTYTRGDSNHYRKAVKLGLPADKGITKAKLLKRDGPLCAICGLMLVYGKDADPLGDLYWSIDHIVPLVPRDKGIVSPGHVWKNVQLAHRICNSKKCNLIEVKYGNVKEDSKTA